MTLFTRNLNDWNPLRKSEKLKRNFKLLIYVIFIHLYTASCSFTNLNLHSFKFSVSKSSLKGLGIGISLVIIGQFTANSTIISYSVLIFEKVKTSIDPYVSSIISAVALICGSLLTTTLADKLGRKMLILMSLVGSAIGLFAVATYYYLRINGFDLSAYEYVPVTSISFVVVCGSAGIVPLAYVCSVEHLPPKVDNFVLILLRWNIFFVSRQIFFLTVHGFADSNIWGRFNGCIGINCCVCICEIISNHDRDFRFTRMPADFLCWLCFRSNFCAFCYRWYRRRMSRWCGLRW